MGLLRAELLQENAVRASTVYPLRDVVSVRSPVLILTTKDDGGIILIALNCQCEAFETLGAQQSEGMPVSRRGSDELVLRRFPEVEVSAVAGPSINGASASFKAAGMTAVSLSTFRGKRPGRASGLQISYHGGQNE